MSNTTTKKYTNVACNDFTISKLDALIPILYCESRQAVILQLIRSYEERGNVMKGAGRPITSSGIEKQKKMTKREQQEHACIHDLHGVVDGNTCVYDAYSMAGTKVCDKWPGQRISLDSCLDESIVAAAFDPSPEVCLTAPAYEVH